MPKRKVTLYCDGAARGNPGPASYGFVILENGETISKGKGRLGETTNNVAEYEALLRGLKECASAGASQVEVRSDSQLLIRQMMGQYKVKTPHILELVSKARALLQHFEHVEFVHIPRAENKEADRLANLALDQRP